MSNVGMANKVMLISSAVSHALAWISYLALTFGLVLWPAWQDGDGEDLRVLATVFAPVALSGLGLLTVLDQGRLADSKPVSTTSAVLLTLFCGLAILSIAFIHVPVSAKLTIGLIVGFYPVILTLGVGRGGRSFLLGIAMVLLLGFSALASLSVGIFFLPAALLMLAATVASLFAESHAPTSRKQQHCAAKSDANQLSETPFSPVQFRRTSSSVHRVSLCLRPAPRALRRRQSPESHHPPSGAQSPAAIRAARCRRRSLRRIAGRACSKHRRPWSLRGPAHLRRASLSG